jgi:NADH-quinone oxidoreductase subunit I
MQGMYVSLLNMIRPKVTEKYPENRRTKVQFERFRGELTMPHNEHNEHKCTACGLCMTNCPNGTIRVVSKKITDEATGKEKRVLDKYLYDIGSCTFCALCTNSCPTNAIVWTPAFEHTVFTRGKLEKQLNQSKI